MKKLILLLFWFPFRFLVQNTPLSIGFAFADFVSKIASNFKGNAFKNYCRISEAIFPDKEQDFHTKNGFKAYRNKIWDTLEFFRYPKYNKENILNRTEVEGEKNLTEIIKSKSGCILLCAHFGFNQGIMPILGYRDIKINQLAARPYTWHHLVKRKIGLIDRTIMNLKDSYEKKLPANFIYIDNFIRPVIEVLRNGEIVVFAFDGRAGNKWIETKIGNLVLNISKGVESISKFTNSPILPCFVIRNGKTYKLVIHKKLDKETPLQDFNNILASYIEMYPEQYIPFLYESIKRAPFDETPLIKNWRELSTS
ncbi:MAG: hypothetical protein JXA60_04555 [Candidatus Coatesbacteria bacterium]|nr:hypothetical protein [Candidatus Coatesbacteria bacterium]